MTHTWKSCRNKNKITRSRKSHYRRGWCWWRATTSPNRKSIPDLWTNEPSNYICFSKEKFLDLPPDPKPHKTCMGSSLTHNASFHRGNQPSKHRRNHNLLGGGNNISIEGWMRIFYRNLYYMIWTENNLIASRRIHEWLVMCCITTWWRHSAAAGCVVVRQPPVRWIISIR